MKKYCIKGKNRLTGQEEVITVPCSLANAVAILKREKAKPAHKRDYIHMKIAVYPIEPEKLNFKNQ